MSLPEYDDDIYDYLDLAPSNIGTNLFNSDSPSIELHVELVISDLKLLIA